ncbi:DUF1326 domain-containing protein [Halomarina litorea]|uniref:DUF1326 domain-containing protein n=1 Tax=Halomarina litorea TaxID=2961595 RepID=UPI0020C26046|nr:DUF1326 domain-containing protein [Halomarina sp. BCD28]
MATEWALAGDYVEACNCDVVCQCVWLEPPDGDVCTASLAWHVREGNFGDVDLGGLSVAMLIRSEEGVMFDPDVGWDVVLLVDERASDEQRSALEDIYLGRAGGVWGVVADTHFEETEVATAPFTFDRDGGEFSVEVGDAVTMGTEAKTGFNDEFGTIAPHPLTSSLEMHTGKSTEATASFGERFDWDVGGNNAFFCDFELANA